MSIGKMLLNWGPAGKVRRNHAFEHATLQVLYEQKKAGRLSGISSTFGFWVFGEVDTEELIEAALEAKKRLMDGETRLAVHPNCGTNFATAGIIGGTFAWLAMLGMRKSWQDRFDRLATVITLVTLGTIIAQPLGPKMQEWVTTEPDLGSLHVTEVQRFVERNPPSHRVLTSY